MCGICGIHGRPNLRADEMHRMLQTIAHRGPDDEGSYIDENIGMGCRRLSIIDLPGGHQPICNEQKNIWIVFNGEIYNFQLLRNFSLEY